MKKVLIISYYWPPSGGAGVQRWLKFVKYLPDFGIDPYVLTVDPKYASYPILDSSLSNDLTDKSKVFYSKIVDPNNFYKTIFNKKALHGSLSKSERKSFSGKISNFIRSNFFVPDSRMLWHLHAKKVALKIIDENNIDTIITTGPPQSTHLIGLKIKKCRNVKWITDFRDPWSKSFFNDYLNRSSFAINKDERLEKKVIIKSDKIVIVSEGMKNDFVAPLSNFETIYNGFDEEDFEDVNEFNSEKFAISYTGTFKDNQNIEKLWNALDSLVEENKAFGNDLVINFVGAINDSLVKELKTKSFSKYIAFHGYVNHSTAIEFMINSSLLLFPIPISEYNVNIITGKIFEYLASRTPMLSIGPKKGIAAKILTSCSRHEMIDYEDELSIKSRILEEYKLWKLEGKKKLLDNKHFAYSRKSQTEKLSKLI